MHVSAQHHLRLVVGVLGWACYTMDHGLPYVRMERWRTKAGGETCLQVSVTMPVPGDVES